MKTKKHKPGDKVPFIPTGHTVTVTKVHKDGTYTVAEKCGRIPALTLDEKEITVDRSAGDQGEPAS